MGTDSKVEYDENILLWRNPKNSLQIVFEVGSYKYDKDRVHAVPGSTFVVSTELIPWQYPFSTTLSECIAVPYDVKKRYDAACSI